MDTSSGNRLREIKQAMKLLAKSKATPSIHDGKLKIDWRGPPDAEVSASVAACEMDLAVLLVGWGKRQGLPRLPDVLPVDSAMLAILPDTHRQAWQRRASGLESQGASRWIAELAAYWQLTDAWVDCLVEAHRPHREKLKRRASLESEIERQIGFYDHRRSEMLRELHDLNEWATANVDR